MGCHDAPGIAHVTRMWDQLPDLDKPWVTSYVDDILITAISQEECKHRTKLILGTVEKTGFKLSWNKAQLVQQEVEYLGTILEQEGCTIIKQTVEILSTLPKPVDVRSVRVLLGAVGCVQDFIPNFAKICRPLWSLTKRDQQWDWGPEHDEAFRKLKEAVMAAPALAYPDPAEAFYFMASHSLGAIGAVLLQETCGKQRPVA
ncbi:unnamed protein product [Natator depressus]